MRTRTLAETIERAKNLEEVFRGVCGLDLDMSRKTHKLKFNQASDKLRQAIEDFKNYGKGTICTLTYEASFELEENSKWEMRLLNTTKQEMITILSFFKEMGNIEDFKILDYKEEETFNRRCIL